MRIEVNGCAHTAESGDAILLYPDMVYTATSGITNVRFIYIHFNFGLGNNLRILDDFNLASIVPGELIKEEGLILKKSYHEYQKKAPLSSIILKGCLILMIARIISACREDSPKTVRFSFTPRQGQAGKLAVLQPVLKHITDHLDLPMRISDLSAVAGMSAKYFIAYFQNALGISPGNYIQQLRMNRARDYLYQGEYSVKQIAQLLGYSDQYVFSKAFKRYFGVPPSKFR